ncbi:hypothetical protein ABZX77_30410 [Streptomyces sp. NPDC004237]|uniref:hypothetical protein n=1 Tax=Streptomyces sp. NPDC004237 TaxID=3154455 RepID=UPI0033A3453B
MSAVQVLAVIVLAVPASLVAVFLLLYTAYGTVAHDVARRLRIHADRLHTTDPLHTAPPGIRYAADLIEQWGKR